MKQKGFTLIELVLVITILGILAVAALPSFINVSTQAEQSSRDGVVGAVRTGIALYKANDLLTTGAPGVYPSTLDAVGLSATCGPTQLCFSTVLSQGVTDSSWRTSSAARVYVFRQDASGTVTYTYTYDNANGRFASGTAP